MADTVARSGEIDLVGFRLLKAFQAETPKVALIDDPKHTLVGGNEIEFRDWDSRFRIGGCLLIFLAVKSFLKVERYGRSWTYNWKPSVIVTLCLLGPVTGVLELACLFYVDSEGRVGFHKFPIFIVATLDSEAREISTVADIDRVHFYQLARTSKESVRRAV